MPPENVRRKPNILFILTDQQRWDTLGCYGQSLSVTPHLDQLAADGVRFEHAFTCQPVCGPARSCLQSGLYATQTGCFTNHRKLPIHQPTLAKSLNQAGYETAYVGKWHLASGPGWDEHDNFRTRPIPPERRGGYKDYWMVADALEHTSHGYEGYFYDIDGNRVDWEGYRVDRTTDFALDYLRDYATRRPIGSDGADVPFFLFLSYIEPHQQNDLDRYIGPLGTKQRFANYRVPGDLAAFESPGSPGPNWRQHFADYLGCCCAIDQNVGRIRDVLKRHRLDQNTLIIYSSDHGCHFRTRPGEYKRTCHDGSLRIPMLACGPGFLGGQVRQELVGLIDLPQTILTAADAEKMPGIQGRPLQQLVHGQAEDWPDDVFAQISRQHPGRVLRTKRWKYEIVAPGVDARNEPGAELYVETHLYDLQNDPYELDNVVDDPQWHQVRSKLAERIAHRMQQAGEPEPIIKAAVQAGFDSQILCS